MRSCPSVLFQGLILINIAHRFGVLGALEEAIALARDYALNRKQFNVPIASFQLVQEKLANANMEAAIGLVSVVQLGRLKDSKNWAREFSLSPLSFSPCAVRVITSSEGTTYTDSILKYATAEMVSLMKRNNCYKATEHVRMLGTILGGNMAADEYHIGRILANLHTVSTYEGKYDIVLLSRLCLRVN